MQWGSTWGEALGYDEYRRVWVWHPDEDKILRQFAVAKKSTRAAAAEIKCTFSRARGRARRLGIHFCPDLFRTNGWTAQEDEELRRGIAAGETADVVAQRLDRGEPATRCRAKRLGLKLALVRPDDPWTEDHLARAKVWWLQGISGGVIANRFGPPFTRMSVIGMMWRKGWHREGKTQAAATRAELKKRSAKKRREERLKIRPAPAAHPLQRIVRWMGPPRPPRFFVALASDVPRISHEMLSGQHCRWPIGEPANAAFKPFFCGRPRVQGLPYCTRHCRRAFNKIPPFPRQSYPSDVP